MVFSSHVVAKSHYEGKVHTKNLRKQGLQPPGKCWFVMKIYCWSKLYIIIKFCLNSWGQSNLSCSVQPHKGTKRCVLCQVWLQIVIMLTRNRPQRVVWSILWTQQSAQLPLSLRLIWRTLTSIVVCVLLPSTIPKWLCSTTMDANTRGTRPDRTWSKSLETMSNKVTQVSVSLRILCKTTDIKSCWNYTLFSMCLCLLKSYKTTARYQHTNDHNNRPWLTFGQYLKSQTLSQEYLFPSVVAGRYEVSRQGLVLYPYNVTAI